MKDSDRCSKCEALIQNSNDVICLNCGALLNTQDTISNNNNSTHTSTTKNSSSYIQSSFSLIFLIITIFISYAYIFNFQIFFKMTDYLFHTKHLTKTHIILQIYKKMALAKDLSLINLKLHQLELEILNTKTGYKLDKSLYINHLNHNINPKNHILKLQISLKNNSPFKNFINKKFFYLKNAENIFNIKQIDDCILVFKPWEIKKISLSFKKFKLDKTLKFNGELIFNNSVKYVNNKIIF